MDSSNIILLHSHCTRKFDIEIAAEQRLHMKEWVQWLRNAHKHILRVVVSEVDGRIEVLQAGTHRLWILQKIMVGMVWEELLPGARKSQALIIRKLGQPQVSAFEVITT